MKKICAILLVCCLLLSAMPVMGEESSADSFLFRGVISFGMTLDEVKEKAEGLFSSPAVTGTENNWRHLSFQASLPFFTTFLFSSTEDTAGLAAIICAIDMVEHAPDNDSSVSQENYDQVEAVLTEKYGKPESASELLSVYINESYQSESEPREVALANILRRVLPQDDGAVLIEHFLWEEVSMNITLNYVAYTYLDQAAYNDYLCQKTKDELHDYLTEIL